MFLVFGYRGASTRILGSLNRVLHALASVGDAGANASVAVAALLIRILSTGMSAAEAPLRLPSGGQPSVGITDEKLERSFNIQPQSWYWQLARNCFRLAPAWRGDSLWLCGAADLFRDTCHGCCSLEAAEPPYLDLTARLDATGGGLRIGSGTGSRVSTALQMLRLNSSSTLHFYGIDQSYRPE